MCRFCCTFSHVFRVRKSILTRLIILEAGVKIRYRHELLTQILFGFGGYRSESGRPIPFHSLGVPRHPSPFFHPHPPTPCVYVRSPSPGPNVLISHRVPAALQQSGAERQIASDGAPGSGARYPWRRRPSAASPGNARRRAAPLSHSNPVFT